MIDVKDFFQLCTMKEDKGHEIYITGLCWKDLVEVEWVIVCPKMLCPQNSGSALKALFITSHNERGEETHES